MSLPHLTEGLAATDDRGLRGDTLQYELHEGPCMDAVWHHDIVISTDLAADQRWPRWAPRVAAELVKTRRLPPT